MTINIYVPIITLNIIGLNALIKKHRVADSVKKKKKKEFPLWSSAWELPYAIGEDLKDKKKNYL